MNIEAMAGAVAAGDRRALARAITLIESQRADHREAALALLAALRDTGRGTGREALRLGLSGTPGVGKSTFIEAFGMQMAEAGKKIAVLAVDPSSARSGGSILGDKTRMERLSRHPNAFIRPSPSQVHMGGVARRSREAVFLCEAAGYDLVLIETVGVGQSETMVAELCDIFLLLMAPAGGDELQGVKRGIMEMADMILVNKADGDLRAAAGRTVADYAGALRLLRKRPQDPEGFPKAVPVSAAEGAGLERAAEDIFFLADWRRREGHWERRRAEQAVHWFGEEVRHGLLSVLRREPARGLFEQFGRDVAEGRQSSEAAAAQVLQLMGRRG